MTRSITHNPQEHRFELTEDQTTSLIDYELDGNTMVITHTRVPEKVGGRGIAGDMTRFALDTARENNWRVRPVCSYAEAWIKRHPEYQDLL